MGYFPSGLSLDAYENDYCINCANYAEGECTVFCMHLLWNYDQVDNEAVRKMLNILIPREGIDNTECAMFRKKGALRETVPCKSCRGSGKDVRYLEDTRDDTCGMCLGTGRRVKP